MRTAEAGLSKGQKIVAGAALGVAVPAVVGVAKKLMSDRDDSAENAGGTRPVRAKTTAQRTGASAERTKDQLYREAKRLGIEGRSKMTKAQLERAVSRSRS